MINSPFYDDQEQQAIAGIRTRINNLKTVLEQADQEMKKQICSQICQLLASAPDDLSNEFEQLRQRCACPQK